MFHKDMMMMVVVVVVVVFNSNLIYLRAGLIAADQL
jgi:hypothetical protein